MGWFSFLFPKKKKSNTTAFVQMETQEVSREYNQKKSLAPKLATVPWFTKRLVKAPRSTAMTSTPGIYRAISEETQESLKVLLEKHWNPAGMPLEVMMMLDDPNSNSRDVARAASSNPEIAARILKSANSAENGMEQEVTDVERAVILLGYNNVQAVLIRGWIGRIFPMKRNLFKQRLNRLWLHSSMVSACSRLISVKLQKSSIPSTLGLLHDLGKFALLSVSAQELRKYLNGEQVEEDVLIATLGKIYGERLGLPATLIKSIELFPKLKYGLEFIPKPLQQDMQIVALAEHSAHAMGFGDKVRGSMPDALPISLYEGTSIKETPLEIFDSSMIHEVEKTMELVRVTLKGKR